jgi:hypothetical protein
LTSAIALQICRYGIDRIIDAGSPQTQHSCDGINANTVATEMAKDLKLTDGNPDKVMQAEDMAELIIAQLKLNRRVFIKNSSIWYESIIIV